MSRLEKTQVLESFRGQPEVVRLWLYERAKRDRHEQERLGTPLSEPYPAFIKRVIDALEL